MSAADVESSAETADALDLLVVSRGATPHEVAAVTAVLRGVLEEEAAHREASRPKHPSAWQRSRRPMRTPLTPGPGRWRGFTG